MSDLKLHLRLTADGTQVQSAVRSTSAELDNLQATTRAVDAAQKTAAQSARAFEQSVARVGASQVPAARAAEQLTGQFKLQKGALQQVGYQVQDFTVQVASGQSALVALAQQGSQLAGVLGPGGALLGAVIAIGSVVASVLVNSMEDGANATDTLRIALSRLDDAVEESDGIPTLAKQIRELAQESEVAARARIVSAMSAAEIASRSSAKAIRDAFDDIVDTVGFSSLSDFFFDAQTDGGMRAIRGAMDDLRESLRLTGSEGEAAAAQIFGALRRLNADPTIENFRALEQTVATVSTGIGASSEPLQTLVATLGQYFDAARNAADKTEFLKNALGNLKVVSAPASQEVQKMVEALQAQAAAIGESRRETSLRIAQDKQADAAQIAAINSAYDLIEAEEKKAKAAKDAEAARRKAEQESLKAAAAERAYAKELENLRSAADPAYAATARLASAKETLDKALAKGDLDKTAYDQVLTSLDGLYSGATAAKAAHEKWLESVQDSIDPLRRFEREAKKVREAFSKGELGDTTASQVEEYLERLRKQAQGTGDALKDAFNAPGKAINEFAEGTGKAIGSLREMFKEGDSGYKALTIGLNALNAMQAINAVLNQSAGDPYTAFARMATMAATVAALGYSVGMGGGGGDRTAANRQAEQGTGSVLGDATAKTESIARATEITADATTALVGLNRSMLVALQGLQAGIAGAVTRIARGAGDVEFDVPGGWSASQQRLAGAAVIAPSALAGTAFQSLQLGSAVGSTILGPIGAVAGALGGKEIVDRTLKVLDKATLGALSAVGKLIGGSSKQVDEGITVVGGTLAELIDETMVSAYATIKSKKYKWSSSKYTDVTAALDADVGRQFELVFQGIAESVTAGAAALGLEQSTIDAAVSGYVVESLRISLQGLKPEEQREALDAVFGKVFDGLAETVIPYIADFTAYGEGLGETLARVANAVMVTEDVVDRLGVRFQQLAGADLADASLRLVELAGGIEELARNSAGFLQNFATPERQMEVITRDLERALGQVNLQLPASRDGFYDLVQAQDASTQSGAEAVATLLRVQDYAAEYYGRLEDAARATAAAAEEAARAAEAALAGLATATDSAMTALQSAVTARVDAAKGAYQTERAALEEKHKAALEQIKAEAASRTSAGRAVNDAFKTSAQALQRELQGISGAIGSLRDAYEPMQEARRVAAMGTLRRALSTGDLTGTGDAAQLASRIEMTAFASLADFQREQGRTLNLLSALEKEGSRQVNWAERAAASIGAQTAVISSVSSAAEAAEKQRFDEQMAELDARHAAELAELESVVTTAQDQLNALRGIETGVLAIPDAIAALAAALAAEQAARVSRDATEVLVSAEAARIVSALTGQAPQQIPQFADGGAHAGGWRVVGERGPELEFTGPSRIYSNTQSKGFFDMGPVIQELRALNQRMAMLEGYSRQTTKNTGGAARVLDRWEGGGMPTQREAIV